jgi:hypothetical protein
MLKMISLEGNINRKWNELSSHPVRVALLNTNKNAEKSVKKRGFFYTTGKYVNHLTHYGEKCRGSSQNKNISII